MKPNDVPIQTRAGAGLPAMWEEAWRYQLDFFQRSVLFLDILRERADNMLAHDAAGLPPLIHFEYEQILDARRFARPANYALLKITACGEAHLETHVRPDACPVIVIDPRAGHGPGIGGFKRDSEVGVAMLAGHPVYFVMFFPEPCPGQTLADVLHALRRFVEEVARRHGRAPVLYGNCQAGWATALLAADCEGLVGPAVLNGSPLSYWAGEADVNPMRLAAGFTGGAWLVHFLSDLGDGRFDGAWLAQNFEGLNPANTLWDKNYTVFANPDTERERFLEFERWWTGFYFLSREEILDIVQNLFVGNKLESGEIRLCHGCTVNLRRIRNPLLIFASSGDNITPPHQALAWIPAVYKNTEDLKAAGQRIVYMLNQHVGHLGIFVSAKVARREHTAILQNVHRLEALEPGLYEMKLTGGDGQLEVAFEPRRLEDFAYKSPKQSFQSVRRLSEWNEQLYAAFVSPWVRATATPWTAGFLKWAHPMRASRLAFSERLAPPMSGVRVLADAVRQNRQPAAPDNPFLAWELAASAQVSASLEAFRRVRDAMIEASFKWIYGNHADRSD
jgi:hypothetical protein